MNGFAGPLRGVLGAMRNVAQASVAGLIALGLAACAPQAPGQLMTGPATPEVAGATPAGSNEQTVDVDGVPFQVFTYRPAGCTLSGILLVFHGVDRNAGPYRDDAVPLGKRYCMLVVAPLFDETRFPSWRYQRGGIVRGGAVQPVAGWTIGLVPRLAAWAKQQVDGPDLPYVLLGHSAGAQFLSRVAAYGTDRPRQVVIANPSTWVRPSTAVAAPYGFGEAFPPAQANASLRRYLALPITVLLGREDTGSRNLATSDEAEEEGSNRFERGQAVFAEASAAARQHGWPFGWRLAVVPGVGHNARRMFTSDAAFEAVARR